MTDAAEPQKNEGSRTRLKSILNLILASTLVFGLFGASAEPSENCLDIAFGLFSVELPDGAAAGPNTGNQLSDFRFETDGDMRLIYANYAPKDEYGAYTTLPEKVKEHENKRAEQAKQSSLIFKGLEFVTSLLEMRRTDPISMYLRYKKAKE